MTDRPDIADTLVRAGDVAGRVGEMLRDAGFAGERYPALKRMPGGLPPIDLLSALDRPDDARLATLMELLSDSKSVPIDKVEKAIAPLPLDDLQKAGMVESSGADVRGLASAFAFDGVIAAGDPMDQIGEERFVASVSISTTQAAHLAVFPGGGTALDLGTGSGVLALIAARESERAVGVDVNPRALSFAAFNQRLNGIENVTWREGDWLEPVRGESFDLVIANLPFAICPDTTLLYRDSGGEGDRFLRQLVRDTAGHVAEGGFATVLCNWIHREDDWEEPLREWAAGLGCDAVLLHFRSQDPVTYAMAWNSAIPSLGAAEFTDTVKRWVDYLEQTGVEQIGHGALVLRRRACDQNWIRAFHLDGGGPSGPGGAQLERVFAGCDFLDRPAAEQFRALLGSPWRPAEGHRLDQTVFYDGAAYGSGGAVLSRQSGLNLSAQVDPRVVPVLVGCDGRRPLSDLIGESTVPEGLDRAGFHSLCINTAKDLIARGFLTGAPLQ